MTALIETTCGDLAGARESVLRSALIAYPAKISEEVYESLRSDGFQKKWVLLFRCKVTERRYIPPRLVHALEIPNNMLRELGLSRSVARSSVPRVGNKVDLWRQVDSGIVIDRVGGYDEVVLAFTEKKIARENNTHPGNSHPPGNTEPISFISITTINARHYDVTFRQRRVQISLICDGLTPIHSRICQGYRKFNKPLITHYIFQLHFINLELKFTRTKCNPHKGFMQLSCGRVWASWIKSTLHSEPKTGVIHIALLPEPKLEFSGASASYSLSKTRKIPQLIMPKCTSSSTFHHFLSSNSSSTNTTFSTDSEITAANYFPNKQNRNVRRGLLSKNVCPFDVSRYGAVKTGGFGGRKHIGESLKGLSVIDRMDSRRNPRTLRKKVNHALSPHPFYTRSRKWVFPATKTRIKFQSSSTCPKRDQPSKTMLK
ncbi:uncharacterized protein BDR25DRAFT_352633 [Lindgomyces ingoldianus]|uniref:Uncharacterized protein n=1 Tax=Lindgomyces ingoldianus TaxID=673940 RepID=A0ACB6R3U5_9PLEO|nr:uncharacterized protein BDR25DRAFT_352633 [Lindgomyces ingoldianus]KAF2473187.1 hypothetical protein BDR25DRAFT_352633 [Lindgomyces ingoldianus]